MKNEKIEMIEKKEFQTLCDKSKKLIVPETIGDKRQMQLRY